MGFKQGETTRWTTGTVIAAMGLSLSALAFALGAPTTTRIFSGQEADADTLPPAQPYSSPSLVSSSDVSNPLLAACELAGTEPYTVNVNASYNLANCFNTHPSGEALTFLLPSTCDGLSSDGVLAPTTQISSCRVDAKVSGSVNNVDSPIVSLTLNIAGPLQSQTIAFASGSDAVPDATSPLYNGGSYTISLSGSSSDVEYEINPLDAGNCTAQVTGSDVIVTSSISSGTGSCRISVFAERDPLNALDQSNTLERNLTVSGLLDQPDGVSIAGIPSDALFTGSTYSTPLELQGAAGGGSITWTIDSNSPADCAVDRDSGVLTGGSSSGDCLVLANIASDGTYAPAQVGPITVTVNAYEGPSVSGGALVDQTVYPNARAVFDIADSIEFANADGTISFSLASGAPSWLSIDSGTGEVSGTVPAASTGTVSFDILVDDGQSRSASVLSATQRLVVSSAAPSPELLAGYSTDALSGYQLSFWDHNHQGVTFPAALDPAVLSGTPRWGFLAPPGQAGYQANARLGFADLRDTLGLSSSLTDGASDANGFRDSSGNLITVSANSADTGGYMITAIGSRTGGAHAIVQLVPLPGTTTAPGNNQQQDIYLASKPWGTPGDTSSDVTGQVLVAGRTDVGATVSADISGVTDPDGFLSSDVSYTWLRDGSAIDGATSSSYTLTGLDEGTSVSVRISFQDGAYFTETLTSTSISPTYASGITPEQRISTDLSAGLTPPLSVIQDAVTRASATDTDGAFGSLNSLTSIEADYLTVCLTGTTDVSGDIADCIADATPEIMSAFTLGDELRDGGTTFSALAVSDLTDAGFASFSRNGIDGQDLIDFLNSSYCGSNGTSACTAAFNNTHSVASQLPASAHGSDAQSELFDYIASSVGKYAQSLAVAIPTSTSSVDSQRCALPSSGALTSIRMNAPALCASPIVSCTATAVSSHTVSLIDNGTAVSAARTQANKFENIRVDVVMTVDSRFALGWGVNPRTKRVSSIVEDDRDNWALQKIVPSNGNMCTALSNCLVRDGGRLLNVDRFDDVSPNRGSPTKWVFPSGSGTTNAAQWAGTTTLSIKESLSGNNNWATFAVSSEARTKTASGCPSNKGIEQRNTWPANANWSDANFGFVCEVPRC